MFEQSVIPPYLEGLKYSELHIFPLFILDPGLKISVEKVIGIGQLYVLSNWGVLH